MDLASHTFSEYLKMAQKSQISPSSRSACPDMAATEFVGISAVDEDESLEELLLGE